MAFLKTILNNTNDKLLVKLKIHNKVRILNSLGRDICTVCPLRHEYPIWRLQELWGRWVGGSGKKGRRQLFQVRDILYFSWLIVCGLVHSNILLSRSLNEERETVDR